MRERLPRAASIVSVTLASVAVALAARLLADSALGEFAPFIFFIGAIAFSALYGGLVAGAAATLLSVVLGNYFFKGPTASFAIDSWGEAIHETAFVVIGVVISVFSEMHLRAVRQSRDHVRQLQSLTSQLTLVEQRQRREIAQKLHDHLQQLLVASRLQLDAARRRVDRPVEENLASVNDLLGQALDYTRTLTVELCPPVLYEGGIGAAMVWLGGQFQSRYGLRVDVTTAGDDASDLPEAARVLLFEAARELLFNIVKHAGTDRASIRMELA